MRGREAGLTAEKRAARAELVATFIGKGYAVTVVREGGAVSLDTGGFFYGPRGRVHGFRCDGPETARLLVFVSPGTGIGAMFAEPAELTRQQGDQVDPAQVAAVCGRHNIAFVNTRTQ